MKVEKKTKGVETMLTEQRYTKLLTMSQMAQISNDWLAVAKLPIYPYQDQFYHRLQVNCRIVLPLGELFNPRLSGYVWVWKLKHCVKPEPITEKHRFNAQGLEGCFSIDDTLSRAMLLYREVSPDRMNIFV